RITWRLISWRRTSVSYPSRREEELYPDWRNCFSYRKDSAMPSFEHHGAHIYYEEVGQGFPILTFAPAGLQSVIAVWSQPSAPINPTTEWAANYRVIAMDQRNAGGQSRAPITAQDGWDSYTADHIALLDHL